MTWEFDVTRDTITVYDPDGNEVTTLTSDGGWTWVGDYPAAVKEAVADHDPSAAIAGNIKQR